VLFDFDLTLADSATAVETCVCHALSQAGLPRPEPDRVRRLIGHSLTSTFAQLAPEYPTEPLVAAFLERADEVMVDLTSLYPPVTSVLTALRQADHRLGIVSTKFRFRIEAILDRAEVTGVFDVIVGGEDVTHFKPHPEGIQRALAELGATEPAESVYVGDSAIDGATAAAAGVPFIGVVSGATSRADLFAAGARDVLADLAALPGLVGREAPWLKVAGARVV